MSDMRNPLRRKQPAQNNRYDQGEYYDEYDDFDEFDEEEIRQPSRQLSRQSQSGRQSQQRPRQRQNRPAATDYLRAQKYFKGSSRIFGAVIVAIAGAVLLITGINIGGRYGGTRFILWGLILIAAAGAWYYFVGRDKVTDQEYDKIVNSMLARLDLENRAMRKLGLDRDEIREIRPIYFDAYRFKQNEQYAAKYGNDNKWRSNKYEVSMLFFCRGELYTYNYVLTTTSDMFTETTNMFFYDDIVSFSTVDESFTVIKDIAGARTGLLGFATRRFRNKQKNKTIQRVMTTSIKLALRGGNSYSATVSNIEGAQRSFDAMRTYLRELKRDSRR